MNNSKHTPGPWTADGTRIKAYKDNGYTKIAKIGDTLPSGTDEANARLIAAAPELLEALQAWQAIYNTRIQDGDTLRDMRLAANQLAETAIAKATERQ